MDKGFFVFVFFTGLTIFVVFGTVFCASWLIRRFAADLPSSAKILIPAMIWPIVFLAGYLVSRHNCALLNQQPHTLWERDGIAIGCAAWAVVLTVFGLISFVVGLISSIMLNRSK